MRNPKSAAPTLRRCGEVFLLDLGDEAGGENRFDSSRLSSLHCALDDVESSSGPAALVTTARGKFWSNGLVPELFDEPGYLGSFQLLLARLLTSELPTVACLQGHTVAGGLLFALAHDERHMRQDRGFACFPEAALGIPFRSGSSALVRARLSPSVSHAAMVTSRRYTASEALEAAIVDEIAGETDLLDISVERARTLAPLRGRSLALIKETMYADVITRLEAIV